MAGIERKIAMRVKACWLTDNEGEERRPTARNARGHGHPLTETQHSLLLVELRRDCVAFETEGSVDQAHEA